MYRLLYPRLNKTASFGATTRKIRLLNSEISFKWRYLVVAPNYYFMYVISYYLYAYHFYNETFYFNNLSVVTGYYLLIRIDVGSKAAPTRTIILLNN